MAIEYPPLPPPPDITPFLADMQALVEEARAAAAQSAPPPPQPPQVIPEELQAQIAELTRQAMAQLQALLDSLRQVETQLPKAPEDLPVTGGPDPLPVGEDDGTLVGIELLYDPPLFVDDAPPPKELPGGEWGPLLARSAVMPQAEWATGAVDAVQVAAEAVDDFVPIAAPAAIEEWAAPPAPAASAASAPAEAEPQVFAIHEFRVGAEGQSA